MPSIIFGVQVLASSQAPVQVLTLGYDRATPEQISLRCPLSAVAAGVTATVEYKLPASPTWVNGGPLHLVRPSEIFLPVALNGNVTDSFVGWVTGLNPGTTYDVRVRVNQPSQAEQIVSGQRATRALPATAPAANRSCTPATFAAVVATLVPGDHLRMSPGTYPLSAPLSTVPSGTAAQPIYISAGTLGEVVFARSTGVALAPNSDHVVWERIKFTGSSSDSGIQVLSQFCVPNTARRNVGWCFRYCEMSGFDAGIKCFEPVDDFLVYENLFQGNNNWAQTYTIPPGEEYPRLTWDDSGLQMPGSGNAAWNNTLIGFGDTFRCHTSAGMRFTAGNYYWRNRVELCGDNAIEADDCAGNVAAYDNLILNSGDILSADGTYGPVGFFRNVCVNPTRGPIKLTSVSAFTRILANTFVVTAKLPTSAHGLLTPGATAQRGLEYRNNLFVYSGPGNLIHWSSPMVNDSWSNNGWTDGAVFINGTGSYANIAAAKAGNPARFSADVVVPAQPFTVAVGIGVDHTTAVVGTPSVIPSPGSPALSAGAVIPGITDGYSGAAPAIGAAIPGRVAVAYGQTPTSGATTWITAQAVGTWGVVPAANSAASVDPELDPLANPNYPAPPPWRFTQNGASQSSGGFARTMSAWCGACFDDATAQLHFNSVGGHTDYFGNASYKLQLDRTAPLWVRYSNPSILSTYSGDESTGKYSDGRSRSAHTYMGACYVPGLGPILTSQQAMATAGIPGAGYVTSFNETTGAETFWDISTPGGGAGSSSCWDSDLNIVWHRPHGSHPMRTWKRDRTPQHLDVGGIISWNGGVSMCHLKGLGCILLGNGDDTTLSPGVPVQSKLGGWAVFDTATGQLHSPVFNGAPTALGQQTLGLWPGTAQPVWDSVRRCAYAWDNRSNTTQIVRLTPGANPRTDPWTIDTVPVSGSNTITPTAAQNAGTFGRVWFWRNCLFVVNAVDQSVYFFKVA